MKKIFLFLILCVLPQKSLSAVDEMTVLVQSYGLIKAPVLCLDEGGKPAFLLPSLLAIKPLPRPSPFLTEGTHYIGYRQVIVDKRSLSIGGISYRVIDGYVNGLTPTRRFVYDYLKIG